MANTSGNLRTVYASAEEQRQSLEKSPETSSAEYQENLQAAIASFEECQRLVDQVALFSPNESVEDISSRDLQWVF